MKIASASAAVSMQKYGIEGIPKLDEICNILNIKLTDNKEPVKKEENNNAQSEETDMPKENVE